MPHLACKIGCHSSAQTGPAWDFPARVFIRARSFIPGVWTCSTEPAVYADWSILPCSSHSPSFNMEWVQLSPWRQFLYKFWGQTNLQAEPKIKSIWQSRLISSWFLWNFVHISLLFLLTKRLVMIFSWFRLPDGQWWALILLFSVCPGPHILCPGHSRSWTDLFSQARTNASLCVTSVW